MPGIFESVMAAAGVGGWELDLATGRHVWTPVMFDIFEVDPGVAPRMERAQAFYPGQAWAVVDASVRAAIETGAAWDIETQLLTGRGRLRWLRSWGQAVRENGATVRLIGAVQDVTERRELIARTHRLAVIAAQMSSVVITSGHDGCVEWVNDALTRLSGYTLAELRGRKPGAVLQGKDTDPATVAIMARGLRAGTGFEVEVLNYSKAGVPYWMAITCSPLHDAAGALTGFVAIQTEIGARRAAEAKARAETADRERAEMLLRDVLDALPNAVVAYDQDERLILANRAHSGAGPVSPRFSTLGERLEDIVRLGVAGGYFADARGPPAEREAWIAGLLAYHRDPASTGRIVPLSDGRTIQMRTRRSETGNLVVVRTDITELTRTEALLRDILEALPSAVIAYDRDERLVLLNSAAHAMLPDLSRFAVPGRTMEEMLRFAADAGQYPDTGGTPEDGARWVAATLAAYRAGSGERTVRLTGGRVVQARERRSESGNLVCVRTDTTELMRVQELLRDVLDALPSAVIAYDRDERMILTNRAYGELYPFLARHAIPGVRLEEFLRLGAAEGKLLGVGISDAEIEAWVAGELVACRSVGPARTLQLGDGRSVEARDRRSMTGNLVCVFTDITELKRAEAHLRQQAERDPLTQLANRDAFLGMLDQTLALQAQGQMAGGVVVVLDIDYFKQTNDTLGHDVGDALLVEVAKRLRLYLRGKGEGASRLGGDEYGVVIPGLTGKAAVAARIDGLHAALSAPAELGGRRMPMSLSMGVTAFPADGMGSARLMKNADLALYEAKRTGRGRWAAFMPVQAQAQARRARMADALRHALAQNRLTVALQPKCMLRNGAHAGFEALARWHDGSGWVPPSDFIPIAEDTGQIRQLGRVVMDAALARVAEIRAAGLEPGRVAVNVAGLQLLDPHFKDETMETLLRHRLCPADLELELTETVLFGRASERIDVVLRQFSQAGVSLALDDFGTGYASLAHLSRLPIDRLKIDRSFVEGIGRGGPAGVIARTVVTLASSLGMESIAEGVETEEQLGFLQVAGCDIVQGFLFSRPLLTTAQAIAYLRGLGAPRDAPKIARRLDYAGLRREGRPRSG